MFQLFLHNFAGITVESFIILVFTLLIVFIMISFFVRSIT
jgi:hypothetical protein